MIETDILIIGAGPAGLFAIFQAGNINLRCSVIDSLPQPGGQLAEIYPKKPIYDIPGFPEIKAGDLIKNLLKQSEPFKPHFTLGERAETLEKTDDNKWLVTTNKGTVHKSSVIVIAGGLGCFEPKKPNLENLQDYENKGIDYIVKEPEKYKNKDIIIAGGGDSALDWTIELSKIAKSVCLVHRRPVFRASDSSVSTAFEMQDKGVIEIFINSEITKLEGTKCLERVEITSHEPECKILKHTDYFIPLFGLSPKLGPVKNWGLNFTKDLIIVNPEDMSTNIQGIYSIGDISHYPSKLRLILSGFYEATIMAHSAYKYIYPEKKLSVSYSTVKGIKPLN
ncbi:MAG: NAD(P)/FAD-dependent oxidoreductase [Bacteroidetes bacterium]|nr:NAD(P)/FAD-dependent oxidoreductase [Bacteroidota bacterium]